MSDKTQQQQANRGEMKPLIESNMMRRLIKAFFGEWLFVNL